MRTVWVSVFTQRRERAANMAKRIIHCDLCSQGKPRLCVDEIIVTIDERDYPVRVCDRHRAVMKNMFLGVIPASAFGDEPPRTPVKRAVISLEGKAATTSRRTATKKAPAKRSTVKATPAKKKPVKKAAKKATVKARTNKTVAAKRGPAKKTAAVPVKRGPGRPRKVPVA